MFGSLECGKPRSGQTVGVADGEVVAIRSAPLLFSSIDLVVRGVVEVVRDEDIVINVHGNIAVPR